MADVKTLIDRIETLREGRPLPGDDEPVHGKFTKGYYARNTAALRCGSLAHMAKVDPIPRRLACELVDNVETLLAALRYWEARHR